MTLGVAGRTERGSVAMVLVAAVAVGGCDDGTGPDEALIPEITVDASTRWTYVALGMPATEVDVADPATSHAWDLAFFGTRVTLNGGDAGPGGVRGYCVCQNADATPAQVLGMTAENQRADFEAVTRAHGPATEAGWVADVLDPAIDGWWTYDIATRTLSANPEAVFKVRTHTGSSYAKLRVIEIASATQAHAGMVTLEFAVQTSAGAAMGPVRTLTVDLAGGPVHVDLAAGTESDASSWDLRLEGFQIRVNGGVSGEGAAGALPVAAPFDAIEDASDLAPLLYYGDAYGGVFSPQDPAEGWYLEVPEGDQRVYPTYNVYLIRTSDGTVYKVQLIAYYGSAGEIGRITLRYAPAPMPED